MDKSADRQLGYLVLICMTAPLGLEECFPSHGHGRLGFSKFISPASRHLQRAMWQIFVQISIPGGCYWHYCISRHHNELSIDYITDGLVVLPTPL